MMRFLRAADCRVSGDDRNLKVVVVFGASGRNIEQQNRRGNCARRSPEPILRVRTAWKDKDAL